METIREFFGKRREKVPAPDLGLPNLPRTLPTVVIPDKNRRDFFAYVRNTGVFIPHMEPFNPGENSKITQIPPEPVKDPTLVEIYLNVGVSGLYGVEPEKGYQPRGIHPDYRNLGVNSQEKERQLYLNEAQELWEHYDKAIAIRAQVSQFLEEVKNR